LAVPAVGDFDLISNRQRLVLELAARRGVVRRLDLVRRFGVSRETARQELARLVAAGFLQRAGAGRGVRYVPPSLR
jgi:DeoR/GlpR family transcriptional regulator of sugar metabolism